MKMKHCRGEIYCRLVLSLKCREGCCHVAHFQKQTQSPRSLLEPDLQFRERSVGVIELYDTFLASKTFTICRLLSIDLNNI